MRFLRTVAPYLLAVVCAVAVFAAGAYCSLRFTSQLILNPKLAQDVIVRLLEDAAILAYLDADKVEKAHAFLVLKQDGNLLALDALSPYLSDETAKSACRLLRSIAKRRADNPSKYHASGNDIPRDPSVAQQVSDVLNNPKACAQAGG